MNISKESSVYLFYQFGYKMYFFLFKILVNKVLEIRSFEKFLRRIKIRRRFDNLKSVINLNYFCLFIFYFLFLSISIIYIIFDEQENLRFFFFSRRGRIRLVSFIDFINRGNERRDQMLEDWLFYGLSFNLFRDYLGEGRARNELYLFFQRLLVEREREGSYRQEDRDQYFQFVIIFLEFVGFVEDRFGFVFYNGYQVGRFVFQRKIVEDYGIYGDEDEEEDFGKDENLFGFFYFQNISSLMKVRNENLYENFY